MRRWIVRGTAGVALLVLATVFVCVQGRRTPEGRPEYVALGSSFAAGAGLGRLQAGSPLMCARSVGGYPQQLARRDGLPIVDMSCGGAVAKHLLRGGQFFQGPQIGPITPETRLVTLTVGGNDIGYIGDLSLLASRKSRGALGWLTRTLWKGPKAEAARDYDGLRAELLATIRAVRAQAPAARIVLVTYPAILPKSGTCDRLQLTTGEADLMRQVGDRLAAVTRSAADEGGALLVDMHRLGASHNACSAEPWTSGWTNAPVARFHPTARGAEATAAAISDALNPRPSAP